MTNMNAIREALTQKADQCDRLAEVSRSPACFEYRAKAQAFREVLALLATDCAAGVGEAERYAEAFYNAWHERKWHMIGEPLRARYREGVSAALSALAASPPAPADASEAIKLAEEYAAQRDWNGAYHALRCALPMAPADASGEVERVREAAAKCDPVLRDKPSVKVMAGLLKLGAEHQRPRSKQYARGEHNAEADAEFIVAAINFARVALNPTAGAK